MWVFTPFGFFSVVRHRQRPDNVLVRARVRADLVALGKRLLGRVPPIRRTPNADYPYRLEVSKARLGEFMRSTVLDLDYPNFKSEVARRQGLARAHAYHEVWSSLMSIEDPGARREGTGTSPAMLSISSR